MREFNLRYVFRKGVRHAFLKSKGRGDHILVACFPKSGSTYLSHIIADLTGYTLRMVVPKAAPHNEQDINDVVLSEISNMNTVTHQHVKGTQRNLELIEKYGIKPIVLTRHILDVVVSAADHIEAEDRKMPMVYIHDTYFEMSREDKLMFLIRNILPWYFSFLISWQEASRTRDVYWTSYEVLFSEQECVLSEIAEFCSFAAGPADIQAARAKIEGSNKTRKNVGKTGRGQDMPDTHKQAARDIARSWQVDDAIMARVGLEL